MHLYLSMLVRFTLDFEVRIARGLECAAHHLEAVMPANAVVAWVALMFTDISGVKLMLVWRTLWEVELTAVRVQYV